MKTAPSLLAAALVVGSQQPEDATADLLELDRAFCRDTSERGLDGWLD